MVSLFFSGIDYARLNEIVIGESSFYETNFLEIAGSSLNCFVIDLSKLSVLTIKSLSFHRVKSVTLKSNQSSDY